MTAPHRTKPSLAFEAAGLAYAEAVAALHDEQERIDREHMARTGSVGYGRATDDAIVRQEPLRERVFEAERAMKQAAFTLWKAEEKRRKGKP